MLRRVESFGVALGISMLGLLPGCQNGKVETATGKFSILSQAERVEYLSDWHYMQRQASEGQARRLNLADPNQYRFLERRLKVAGKNAENSPCLFKFLAAARVQPMLSSTNGGVNRSALTATQDAGRGPVHITAAQVSAPLKEGMGAAQASFPSRAEIVDGEEVRVGTVYTYLDVTFSDTNGTPLADLGVMEDYVGGEDVRVSTSADLTKSKLTSYVSDSTMFEVYVDELGAEHYESTYTLETRSIVDGSLTYDVAIEAPDDVKNNDDIINVCLNRSWLWTDCDYDLTGAPQALKLPLKGSIMITDKSHIFNARAIQDCKDLGQCDFDQNGTDENDGYIILKLNNIGGGCQAENSFAMRGFWQYATVSPNKANVADKVLSWDLTEANAASFGAGCRQSRNEVSLLMKIRFPVRLSLGGKDMTSVVMITTPGDNGDVKIGHPIMLSNSCFAAGTLIETADGKLVPIETIVAGDRTSMPTRDDRRSLTVTDTAKGFELESMVRIKDESGRSLLMTSMHPIATLDRGMVIAKNLKQGDVVLTKTGPSKLVEVGRERYDGKVYNLKVGSVAEKAGLGPDDTVVFANGFLAGDGQIQARYEQKDLAKASDALKRLPARWQRDYEFSQARKVAQRR